MKCLLQTQSPYSYPCGKCANCTRNAQRKLVGRMVLEANCHDYTSFATLTYADENLPYTESYLQTLRARDLTLWFKRMRKALSSGNHGIKTFRYFACGEYGEKYGRPHYHAILFGVPPAPYYETLIADTWGLGHISLAEANPDRFAYTAGYVLKKMDGDSPATGDMEPEFRRMSRGNKKSGPAGIGQPYVDALAGAYMTRAGSRVIADQGDIGSTFRQGGKEYPLDYYIQQKLREQLGIPLRRNERETLEPTNETESVATTRAKALNATRWSNKKRERSQERSSF